MDFFKFYQQIKDNLSVIIGVGSGFMAIWSLLRTVEQFKNNDRAQTKAIKLHSDSLINMNGKIGELDKKMVVHEETSKIMLNTLNKIDIRLEKLEDRQIDIYRGLGYKEKA